jgi:hypothetical protein
VSHAGYNKYPHHADIKCNIHKVEEKGEYFSLRKLRKPGEREREKYFAHVFEISHTKRENPFL